jgi:TPR repeat protein
MRFDLKFYKLKIIKYWLRVIRVILVCVFMSSALTTAHASTALTSKQVDTLAEKVHAGNKAAVKKLMAEARRGNKYAQYSLGGLYFMGQQVGEGLLQDFYEGEYWIRRAAQQGLIDAQRDMGTIYHDDVGFEPVPAESAYWHRRAASQGNSRYWRAAMPMAMACPRTTWLPMPCIAMGQSRRKTV